MLARAHELDWLERMEQVRIISYFSVLPHLKEKMTIQQFFPLVTDAGMSKEEKKEAAERAEQTRQMLIADFKKRHNITT